VNEINLNTCEVCGSNKRVFKNQITNQYLCDKHREQIIRYGFIKERTRSDLNEIVLYDNYAEIILYNKNHEEIARTLINLEDVEICKQYKWYLKDTGYAVTNVNNNGKRTTKKLHQIIIGDYLDHANKNRLDNRRENLRIASKIENNRNVSIGKNNTSGIIGVKWDKRCNKWSVIICVNYKSIFLGRFENIEDATIARLRAEKEYFKEFAPQKHLFEKYAI
jgi:hypothetical protein